MVCRSYGLLRFEHYLPTELIQTKVRIRFGFVKITLFALKCFRIAGT